MNKLVIGFLGVLVVFVALFFLKERGDENYNSDKDLISEESEIKEIKNAAYVALGEANSVAVLDLDSNTLKRVIPASNNPHGVAVANGYILTSSTKMGPKEMAMAGDSIKAGEGDMSGINNSDGMSEGMDGESAGNPHHPAGDGMKNIGGDTIAVISQKTGKIVKEINLGGGSHHMAASPNKKIVAVAVPSKNGIAIIDTENLDRVSFIETGKISNYIVFSQDGKKIYVSNSGEDTISIVDLKTKKVNNISTSSLPDHIVLSPNGKFIYVANGGSDEISIIDAESQKVIKTISVGKTPHGISILPNGTKLYVANSENTTISVIDLTKNEVNSLIELEEPIAHLEVVPSGKKLLANSEDAKKIYVIDTKKDTVVNEIYIGEEPHQIAF